MQDFVYMYTAVASEGKRELKTGAAHTAVFALRIYTAVGYMSGAQIPEVCARDAWYYYGW